MQNQDDWEERLQNELMEKISSSLVNAKPNYDINSKIYNDSHIQRNIDAIFNIIKKPNYHQMLGVEKKP